MSKRSAEHATFTIERRFDAAPATVFALWADPRAKARWFAGGGEWKEVQREQDFRVGGRERLKGRWQGGKVSVFDAVYLEIVPNERIIYSYDMHLDQTRISISLATIEFKPTGAGTRLVVTEQGVFLDGYDDGGSRERGTAALLDQLAAVLAHGT